MDLLDHWKPSPYVYVSGWLWEMYMYVAIDRPYIGFGSETGFQKIASFFIEVTLIWKILIWTRV